jgi:signal transduction histidine kinase/CheY-like chemotaxis protein
MRRTKSTNTVWSRESADRLADDPANVIAGMIPDENTPPGWLSRSPWAMRAGSHFGGNALEKPSNDCNGREPESVASSQLSFADEAGTGIAPAKPETHPRFYALRVDYALQVLRFTGVAIAGYQLLFLTCDYLTRSRVDRVALACYGFNTICGFAILAASFIDQAFCERHWRGIAMSAGTAVILNLSLIASRQHAPEPLVLACVLFILGAGAFFPWELRWQILFTTVPLVSMATALPVSLSGSVDNVWRGLWLFSAAGIGLVATVVASRFRHASEKLVGRLTVSEQRRRALLIEHEAITRKLANSETILRAAFRAKSEFLSSISHEIRTPMHLVLGGAELLDETPLDLQQREYLAVMRNNGTSLLHLLDDILDLAKVESGRLMLEESEFSLEALFDEAAEAMGVRAGAKGLELVTRVAPDIPSRMLGDALRTRQILINLIGNAIKFTERGEVVVSVSREDAPANPMMLHFTVHDTGIGIAAEQLEEIFGNFAQADSSIVRRFGGTGLGLAIVRRLADLMGGKAWAESTPSGGSTFHFTARFFATDTAVAAASERLSARILVIDDNRACRDALYETLAQATASVELVANGNEGLACAKMAAATGHPFDVILLDSRIPGTDSFAVARDLGVLCTGSGKVVMMLTAHDLTLHLARLPEIGGAIHVVKPLRRTELFGAIAEAMRSRDSWDASASALAAPAPANDKPGSGMELPKRILLSDDSVDNRMLIKAFFKGLPYLIDEAENGEIALRKFSGATYDVVLMDLQMPVMDGLTATRAIRVHEASRELAPTPIIALTASALAEDVQQSLAAGANTHITKPVSKAALVEAVRNAMSSPAGRVLSSAAAA